MLHKFGWIIAIIMAAFSWFFYSYDPPVTFYNRAGRISKQMKVWTDTISLSSANPSVNISTAGFSKIISVQPQIIQTAVSTTSFIWCNVTSFTTSSVTLFLTQENSSTVNILGSIVLLGTPLQQPSSFPSTFVALQVIGY